MKSTDEAAAEAAFCTVKEIIRRAIITLWTIKDPDRKYLSSGQSGWLLSIVRQRSESYGWGDYGFEPTAHDISQMEVVAGWLAWLRRTEGEQALRRIIAWTLGVQSWRMGQREKCSERTIRNRIDRSVAAIVRKFAEANFAVETIEDLTVTHPYSMVLDRPAGGNEVMLRKVYVYDKGFYLGSRRLRTAQEDGERLSA